MKIFGKEIPQMVVEFGIALLAFLICYIAITHFGVSRWIELIILYPVFRIVKWIFFPTSKE